ncbi:MAG: flagellar hook-length control protein FliK [Candidatus Adiutrix sp.]|jgi:hypothetical protein|nr:flagellar hook-length control protein FliK [Candidatus Adiutrix sp.]
MLNIISGLSGQAGNIGSLSGSAFKDDGDGFSQVLSQALSQSADAEGAGGALAKVAGGGSFGPQTAARLLGKYNLSAQAEVGDNPYSFKKGWLAADKVKESLDLTGAAMPAGYKEQIGLGLMALGRAGSSVNSMKAGADLSGCRSALEALNGILSGLGAELSVLKLDKGALPTLGRIMSAAGVSDDRINEILAELAGGSMTMDQVFRQLQQVASGETSGSGGGLTATEDGLPALGQFFGSLGASPEMVDAITNGFKAGDAVTAASLREIIGNYDDGLLAPCLSDADAANLKNMLQSMGVGRRDMNTLSTLLTHSQGRLSMDGFLNFIEGMEKTPLQTATTADLNLVQALLEQTVQERQLVKTPVFDEIMIKMQALGDRQIDDDFMELSPALQALKGGIAGLKNDNAGLGGQADGRQGGREADQEAREHFRQALQAQNSETTPAAAMETAETVQGYGGQESLARQIGRKMIYSCRRGVHRLRMNLNPESMGRLDIELTVKGDQLAAHIRAENREAYEALTAEAEALKEALWAGGIEISDLTISFDDKESGRTESADLRALWGAAPAKPEELNDDERGAGAVNRIV